MSPIDQQEHVSVIVPGSGRVLFFPCLIDFSWADPKPDDLVVLSIVAWKVFPCGVFPPQPIVPTCANLGSFMLETAEGRWHNGGEGVYPSLEAAKRALIEQLDEDITETRRQLEGADHCEQLVTALEAGALMPGGQA